MKIADQNLQLSSQHYLAKEALQERAHEKYINGQLATRELERTRVFEGGANLNQQAASLKDLTDRSPPSLVAPNNSDIELSEEMQNFAPQSQIAPGLPISQTEQVNLPPRLIKMIEAVEAMMERITGKPYTMKVMGYHSDKEDNPENNDLKAISNENTATSTQFNNFSTQISAGQFSLGPEFQNTTGERWTFHSRYSEIEQTSFSAKGSVTTADGRNIEFNMNNVMHREFHSEINIEKQEGVVLVDPLVVNFGGEPATLTVDKINFDLNNDGKTDNISFVKGNSGFLAFDQNQDGVINNGSELFGAMSGNGFTELAQFDDDQNGWIDENDAIFSQLQIWQKDDHGLDKLSGLMELNIGAIALQNIETDFAIKDSNNQQHGQITHSGIYLKESGGVGSIQQVDLVV